MYTGNSLIGHRCNRGRSPYMNRTLPAVHFLKQKIDYLTRKFIHWYNHISWIMINWCKKQPWRLVWKYCLWFDGRRDASPGIFIALWIWPSWRRNGYGCILARERERARERARERERRERQWWEADRFPNILICLDPLFCGLCCKCIDVSSHLGQYL